MLSLDVEGIPAKVPPRCQIHSLAVAQQSTSALLILLFPNEFVSHSSEFPFSHSLVRLRFQVLVGDSNDECWKLHELLFEHGHVAAVVSHHFFEIFALQERDFVFRHHFDAFRLGSPQPDRVHQPFILNLCLKEPVINGGSNTKNSSWSNKETAPNRFVSYSPT